MREITLWVGGHPYKVARPEDFRDVGVNGILGYATVEIRCDYDRTRVWVNTRHVDLVSITEDE